MVPLLESRQTTEHYVDETNRVLLDDTLGGVIGRGLPVDQLPGLEPCGPAARSSSTRRRPAPRSSPAEGGGSHP
jgi:hypothetical protein